MVPGMKYVFTVGLYNILLSYRYRGMTMHNINIAKGNNIAICRPRKYIIHIVAHITYIVAHINALCLLPHKNIKITSV